MESDPSGPFGIPLRIGWLPRGDVTHGLGGGEQGFGMRGFTAAHASGDEDLHGAFRSDLSISYQWILGPSHGGPNRRALRRGFEIEWEVVDT